ncbi:tRNA uracil 4-sulfurtransferase ThiI [Alkalilimnicola sp. S0819]|uniref:tRNA uracil 4-sulfurtransferase ThiI n=1 Tax=Alkalilimnicola sp. S0819 TaxID=2613922 RepID=UPI0012618307|nr:tRNA uracil 4-sulfurtransferase ThiI [Alkalilimnicola sp. S0819]KAB7619643.1 tRNA 4-thiouridine(8) synthase ThiI [Alkalilimnicola sp. S0819]MPQ17581.1 tRNA 4-thiouridine(8) synthase ThiI [Alkalilimnicola sp. S0819]
MQANRILVSYAEIALKGRNRADFERALRRHIRQRLRADGLDWPVRQSHQRIYVEVPPAQAARTEEVLELLGQVAGIANYTPVISLSAKRTGQAEGLPSIEPAAEILLEIARRQYREGLRFAVRVNRADKRFPGKSDELGRELGARILQHTDWSQVSLSKPDVTFRVDIYSQGMFVYAEKHPGMGGLPVGTTGHALALLSGGIDSPVAAWTLFKRGCRLDFMHMTASPAQQKLESNSVVMQLARQLSRYGLRCRLHLLPYTHFDLGLMGHNSGYDVVMFRRFMFRTAQALAERIGAAALVAGDSLGQVASQTLENMVSSSRALEMPILRPLVGLDKNEIIDIARRIGTYETSIQPYKDCCALLSGQPKTRSSHEVLERMEREIFPDYPKLIEDTLAEMVTIKYFAGKAVTE